jgi:hypothetical protein
MHLLRDSRNRVVDNVAVEQKRIALVCGRTLDHDSGAPDSLHPVVGPVLSIIDVPDCDL